MRSSTVGPYAAASQLHVSNQSTAGSSQGAGASNPVSLLDDLETKKQNWAYIMEGATPDEAMEWVIEQDPYMVVMNFRELQVFITNKF